MVTRIVIAVVAVLAVLGIAAATRPASFSISRAVTIAAPPAVVYAQVADFHAWQPWSPWERLDPHMKKTFSGTPGQPGSIYEWTGNSKVGEGRMTLLTAQMPAALTLKLEFIKPFAATNQSEFAFAPSGPGTLVTWSMSGENNFMQKLFGIFVNIDKMVGSDFERGLSQLKAVSEGAARQQQATAGSPPNPPPSTMH